MFSTLSSLLPSSLHINLPGDKDNKRIFTQDNDDDDNDDGDHPQPNTDDDKKGADGDERDESKKKSKKDKASETFIIVRPPPSKSNHPLNLQVQLVPPNVKPPSGVNPTTPTTATRSSFDSTAPTPTTAESGNDLTRTTSSVSTSTTASSFQTSHRTSSTASFSSITSSSTTGRRTIIPLYNLQAHNVLTNVVVDAGTDAKIARFQKRGIEMMDLAVIEPVEVWGDPSAKERQGSTDEVVRNGNGARVQDSAASSAVSLTSTSHSHNHTHTHTHTHGHPMGIPIPHPVAVSPPLPTIPQTPPTAGSGTGKRNIFGKFFKKNSSKKDVSSAPSSPSPSTTLFSSPSHDSPTPKQRGSLVPDVNVTPSPTTTRQGHGHGRNHSLTTTLAPLGGLKATLRNNKNRLSAALDGSSSSSSSPLAQTFPERRRSPSPNPSAVSILSSGSHNTSLDASHPLHLAPTQTQMETIREREKQEKLQLRPPILGIQPTYVSSSTQPATRGNVSLKGEKALMYVWLVRRWLKRREGDESGLLGALGAVHLGGPGSVFPSSQQSQVGGNVEVRFEWKRAKGKKDKVPGAGEEGKKRGRRGSSRSRRRSTFDEEDGNGGRGKRFSGVSFGTTDEDANGDGGDKDKEREREEDGDDSDPEDSETPWICTLKIRRAAAALSSSAVPTNGRPGSSQGQAAAQVLKVKVGTLSPTPHHPKVVAMLKVPFPLPDVEVERMGIVRRKGVAGGVGGKVVAGVESQQSQQQVYGTPVPFHGTTLTAEEIKDIVSCTGLWLIVREGFGGVGRVSRKGDGWRIRA